MTGIGVRMKVETSVDRMDKAYRLRKMLETQGILYENHERVISRMLDGFSEEDIYKTVLKRERR